MKGFFVILTAAFLLPCCSAPAEPPPSAIHMLPGKDLAATKKGLVSLNATEVAAKGSRTKRWPRVSGD